MNVFKLFDNKTEIAIDGVPKDAVDSNAKECEITFLFNKNAPSLGPLKKLSNGGSVAPQFILDVNNVKYDVYAMGARTDSNLEISMYCIKI